MSRERLEDDPTTVPALGLPGGHSPCVPTLPRVFKVLDVAALDHALSVWLAQTEVTPTDALALDGKTLHVPAIPIKSLMYSSKVFI